MNVHAINGAVLLLLAGLIIAMTLLAITEQPTRDELEG